MAEQKRVVPDENDWALIVMDHERSLDRDPSLQLAKPTGYTFSTEHLANHNLSRAEFTNCDFRNVDFTAVTLHHCQFDKCLFNEKIVPWSAIQNPTFVGCDLDRATIEDVEGSALVLRHGNHHRLTIRTAPNASGADLVLDHVQFSELDICGCVFDALSLDHCDGTESSFNAVTARKLFRFTRSSLSKCSFKKVQVTGAQFTGGGSPRRKFTECSFQNASMPGAVFAQLNVDGSDFRNANIDQSQWNDVILDGADLRRNSSLFGRNRARFDGCDGEENALYGHWLTWARLRIIRTLPFFGVSYFAIVGVCAYVAAMRWINAQIIREEELAPNSGWVRGIETIPTHPVWLWALISAVLVAIGSTIYWIGCPRIIQSQSEEDWRFVLNRSLPEYRAISANGLQRDEVRYRPTLSFLLRLACICTVVVGGLIALLIVFWKVGGAVVYLFPDWWEGIWSALFWQPAVK